MHRVRDDATAKRINKYNTIGQVCRIADVLHLVVRRHHRTLGTAGPIHCRVRRRRLTRPPRRAAASISAERLAPASPSGHHRQRYHGDRYCCTHQYSFLPPPHGASPNVQRFAYDATPRQRVVRHHPLTKLLLRPFSCTRPGIMHKLAVTAHTPIHN